MHKVYQVTYSNKKSTVAEAVHGVRDIETVPSVAVLTERYGNHLYPHTFLNGKRSGAILADRKDEFFRSYRHELHKVINGHRSPELISSVHHSLNPFLPSLGPSGNEHARDIKYAVLLNEQLNALQKLEDMVSAIEPVAIHNGPNVLYLSLIHI